MPIYNFETGEFSGLQKWLAYIIERGDEDKTFLSYGYDEDNSNVLYSTYKQILPNIFQGTPFKKQRNVVEWTISSRLLKDVLLSALNNGQKTEDQSVL